MIDANIKTPKKRRCLVVYDHLPHYRYGVFVELEDATDWDFVYAAARTSRDGSIATIPTGELTTVVPLRNIWLGRLLWQKGLTKALLGPYDCAIFLGNAANLSTWMGALLCRILNRPVFFWTIGWHRPDKGIRRILRTSFYSLADCLMLYGEDGLRIGTTMGYSPEKMTIIGNSHVSSASQHSDAVGIGLPGKFPPENTPCIGAVVRLSHDKRLELLIDAVALLRERGRPLSVLLTGEGPAAASLRAMAKAAKVPLYLTGALYSDDALDEVYARLLVTALPERAGLTVIQSLQHGVPVVTVDDAFRQVPEYRAVLPGATGDLYVPGSVESLAEAIARVLDMVASNPTGVARACREEVSHRWSPQQHAARIIEVLDQRVPN